MNATKKRSEDPAQDEEPEAKKAKTSSDTDVFLEIRWGKVIDIDTDEFVTHSVFADQVEDEFNEFVDKKEFEQGDEDEYTFDLCLVDSKNEDRKTLVQMTVYYWNGAPNLMQFNCLSSDLADFCRCLWSATGRDEGNYDDMAIELGSSQYSKLEVLEMLGDDELCYIRDHGIMYIKSVDKVATAEHSRKLFDLLRENNIDINTIAHDSDLRKLGLVGTSDKTEVGFLEIDGGWYVT